MTSVGSTLPAMRSRLPGPDLFFQTTVQRLQTEFRRETRGSAASFFVGAGDLISASPFESSVFKDEPTLEVR